MARLLARTTPTPGGCWVSNFTPSQIYPHMRIDGEQVFVHVYSYNHHHGPVPEGSVVSHLCHTPRCWRPDHLTAESQSANLGRSPTRAAANAAKDRCPQGHRYDHVDPKGSRRCKQCHAQLQRKYRKAKGKKLSV
jgi:hypothetical protein